MSTEDYSWVQTHLELTDYLRTKENDQQELLDLLNKVGIGPLNDRATEGVFDTELDEIDPFTFYSYIYKYGSEKRLHLLQSIAEEVGVHVPSNAKC